MIRFLVFIFLLPALIGCGDLPRPRSVVDATPRAAGWLYDTGPNAWICTKKHHRLDFFTDRVREVQLSYKLAAYGATFRLFELDVLSGVPVVVWEDTPKPAAMGSWEVLHVKLDQTVKHGWFSVQVPNAGDSVTGLLVR